MRVSEAKEKVCPFSIPPIVTAVNLETGQYDSGHCMMKCICGDCMAWVPRIGAIGERITVDMQSEEFSDLYARYNHKEKGLHLLYTGDGIAIFELSSSNTSEEGYCARIGNA